MAIKIRCSDCTKKISIDEAFAGGACRCPYCKAIMMVPGEPTGSTAARPATPGAPAVLPEDAPMADRVLIQSYAAVIMIGVLLLVMIAGVVVFIMHRGGDSGEDKGKVEPGKAMVEVANPFKIQAGLGGPTIAGDLKIEAPVVYVIDCGSSMDRMIDMSAKITSVSIRSLESGQQFTVIMATSGKPEEVSGSPKVALPKGSVMLENGFTSGGKDGEKLARTFFGQIQESASSHCGLGRVDVVPTLKAALELNPRTIVVYTNKELNNTQPVIDAARKAGVKIVTLAMDADTGVQESLQKLSEAAQSECRAYSFVKLSDWANEFKNEDE